jgi:hypothetical protein
MEIEFHRKREKRFISTNLLNSLRIKSNNESSEKINAKEREWAETEGQMV